MLKAAKFPTVSDECNKVDVIDGLIQETVSNLDSEDPLEHLMLNNSTISDDNPKVADCAQLLEASTPIPPSLLRWNHYKMKRSPHLMREKLSG